MVLHRLMCTQGGEIPMTPPEVFWIFVAQDSLRLQVIKHIAPMKFSLNNITPKWVPKYSVNSTVTVPVRNLTTPEELEARNVRHVKSYLPNIHDRSSSHMNSFRRWLLLIDTTVFTGSKVCHPTSRILSNTTDLATFLPCCSGLWTPSNHRSHTLRITLNTNT